MTDALKALPFIAVVAFLLYAIVSSGSPSAKNNHTPIEPTRSTYDQINTYDSKPYGSVTYTYPDGDPWAIHFYRDRVPRYEAGSATAAAGRIEYVRNYAVLDIDHDFGAWINVYRANDRSAPFDIGLRYSPARLAWGVVAPDFLLSDEQAGIGLSFYLPDQAVNSIWNRFGVGCGWLTDFNTGDRGYSLYFSLTSRL